MPRLGPVPATPEEFVASRADLALTHKSNFYKALKVAIKQRSAADRVRAAEDVAQMSIAGGMLGMLRKPHPPKGQPERRLVADRRFARALKYGRRVSMLAGGVAAANIGTLGYKVLMDAKRRKGLRNYGLPYNPYPSRRYGGQEGVKAVRAIEKQAPKVISKLPVT